MVNRLIVVEIAYEIKVVDEVRPEKLLAEFFIVAIHVTLLEADGLAEAIAHTILEGTVMLLKFDGLKLGFIDQQTTLAMIEIVFPETLVFNVALTF
jgi:hypothetical protein